MEKWVSVKERYPSSPGRYLVCAVEGGKWQRVTIGDYGDGRFYRFAGRRAYWKITHWMYIPDPPQEETET